MLQKVPVVTKKRKHASSIFQCNVPEPPRLVAKASVRERDTGLGLVSTRPKVAVATKTSANASSCAQS